MKILSYIKYFFFLALNWSPRLAFFSIQHEIKGENKYGISTTGTDNLGDEINEDVLKHSEHYQGANYYILEKLFEFLKEECPNKNLVDFGSGKGRVLCVAAHYEFKKITGVEISERFNEIAKSNILSVQSKFPDTIFQIIQEDASKFQINNETGVFLFFNPFDEIIMLKVVKNIMQSINEFEREVFVAYINPVHKEVFLSAGFVEVYHHEKLEYIECSILMYSSA
ncbi:MAG: hypothetical protein NVS3B19_18770 [Ginsengibacter sp.]